MKITCLKVFAFFVGFIFLQLEVMPWLSQNEFMPLWADIGLMSGALMLFVALIDRLASRRSRNELID